MRPLLTLSILCLPAMRLCAQTPLIIKTNADDVRDVASGIRADIPDIRDSRLVTDYTFHRSFTKEFSKIVSVENANNGDVAYAALSLDKAGGSFNLAPLTFRRGDKWPGWVPYLNGNIHFMGKLGTDGSSTLFRGGDFAREWQAGLTLNIVLGNKSFFAMERPSHLENHFDRYQHAFIDEIEAAYLAKVSVSDRSRASEVVGNAEILADKAALKKAMRTAYSDLEEKMAKSVWTATYTQWISIAADAGRTSRDIRKLPGTENDAKKMDLFTSQLSYNIYFKRLNEKCDHHLYITVPFRLVLESTLTGVTPNTWNKVTGIADSAFLIADQKAVYVVNDNFNTGFSKAAGLQALYIAEWENFAIGANASLTYNYFFWDKGPGSRPSSYTQTYGVVFPLRNKDGARAVNIELFYSKKADAGGTSLGDSELWGLRFAIPVLSFK